jgi:hypothetical protein
MPSQPSTFFPYEDDRLYDFIFRGFVEDIAKTAYMASASSPGNMQLKEILTQIEHFEKTNLEYDFARRYVSCNYKRIAAGYSDCIFLDPYCGKDTAFLLNGSVELAEALKASVPLSLLKFTYRPEEAGNKSVAAFLSGFLEFAYPELRDKLRKDRRALAGGKIIICREIYKGRYGRYPDKDDGLMDVLFKQ